MSSNALPDASSVPLVVDIDGTLLQTDLLAESFRALLLKNPLEALRGLRLCGNKPAFKQYYADRTTLQLDDLPVNADMLAFIEQAKAEGRKVYLASASDHKLVEAVAAKLGLFDGFFGSDGTTNLRADAKAALLCEAFGERGFDYAGDSVMDFPVWEKAREVIVTGRRPGMREEVLKRFPGAHILGKAASKSDYASALRVHQWAKNLLILVPTFAAHMLDFTHICMTIVAFISFCLCASSVYLLNDWFDLSHDRSHPTKRLRMLASGSIPMSSGLILIPGLLLASLVLALFLPKGFAALLFIYYLMTFAYSLWLKNEILIDVVTLACLYGIRIVAGGALGIPLSDWLLAFSFFLFLSLAIVKRCAELISNIAQERDAPSGRGYLLSDAQTMLGMAGASGYVAVLVLALYIQHPDVHALYRHPGYLWGACVILTYWISRILLLTSRGQMHEDPVLFALRDRVSLICSLLILALAGLSI